VTAAVPLIGLALGMLLVAVGLALWNDRREKTARLSRAAQVIGWAASALLVVAVPLLWLAGHGHYTRALHLTLMATIAAPRINQRDTISTLPALALVGGSLFLVTRGTPAEHSALTLVGLAFILCGGLGARVLGEALSVLANPDVPLSRTFDGLYLLLTLLVGSTALANLWQRGSVWGEAAGEAGLVGVWLAWGATWSSPRERHRLRAGLVAVAALLLILLTLRIS